MDEAGYVPGKELGTILQELLQLVTEEPELNDKMDASERSQAADETGNTLQITLIR